MDTGLKEKVQKDLEDSGFLFDMQAFIRDQVFSSIKSQQKESIFANNNKPQELDSDIGSLACALVFDFLDKFDLKLSMKLISQECFLENQENAIKDLENSLGIKSLKKKPLLFELVERMFVGEDDESEYISTEMGDVLVESAGTSQGHDQSVNSLAIDDFDYVEVVRKNK